VFDQGSEIGVEEGHRKSSGREEEIPDRLPLFDTADVVVAALQDEDEVVAQVDCWNE